MTSLYLGRIGGDKGIYEIHALTSGLPFREFKSSQISDNTLFNKVLEGRYNILESQKPIYSTAVSPDIEKKIELNPHDIREGTIHLVAIDKNGCISGALSAAVDIGSMNGGESIGVPLENRWKTNGYPLGPNLDPFRAKYARKMYGEDRDIKPFEIAELYRHYKKSGIKDLAPRMGLYTGWYHIGVREAEKNGKTPSTLWVFGAVKDYYNLYKLVGGGVLREPTIGNPPKVIAPPLKEIKEQVKNGEKALYFRNDKISRLLKVPIPSGNSGALQFNYEKVPVLDGVVDARKRSDTIKKNFFALSLKGEKGFTIADRMMLRIGLTVVAKRSFERDHHTSNHICKFINRMALRRAGINKWAFNHIGR